MQTKENILKIANKIIQSQKEIKTLKDKKLLAIENLYLIHLQSKIVKFQNLDFDLVLLKQTNRKEAKNGNNNKKKRNESFERAWKQQL